MGFELRIELGTGDARLSLELEEYVQPSEKKKGY